MALTDISLGLGLLRSQQQHRQDSGQHGRSHQLARPQAGQADGLSRQLGRQLS